MSVGEEASLSFGSLRRCEASDVGLRTLRRTNDAKVELIWLPFGGGSSHVFSAVAAYLPTDWTIHAVEYPGHLHGWGKVLDQVDHLCEALIQGLGTEFLESSWLVGHSMGGLVSVRLAHLLELQGRGARGCIVGAAKPPARIDPWPHLSNLSYEDMLARWLSMVGQDKSTAIEALFDLLEPVLRADMRVYESCSGMDAMLSCTPLLVLSSNGDEIAPAGYASEWRGVTPCVRTECIDGGHLFVLSNPSELAKRIERFVRKVRLLRDQHAPSQLGCRSEMSSR